MDARLPGKLHTVIVGLKSWNETTWPFGGFPRRGAVQQGQVNEVQPLIGLIIALRRAYLTTEIAT